MTTFYFGVTAGNKVTAMSRGFFMWFHYSKEEGDDNFRHLLQWLVATKWRHVPFLWFCCEEGDDNNVVTFHYGGGVVEKAMVGGDFFLFFVVLLV